MTVTTLAGLVIICFASEVDTLTGVVGKRILFAGAEAGFGLVTTVGCVLVGAEFGWTTVLSPGTVTEVCKRIC